LQSPEVLHSPQLGHGGRGLRMRNTGVMAGAGGSVVRSLSSCIMRLWRDGINPAGVVVFVDQRGRLRRPPSSHSFF